MQALTDAHVDFLENKVEMEEEAEVKKVGWRRANHRTSVFSLELD